jgi:hypothetical protein
MDNDIIDISMDFSPTINKKSSNFGGGIELLMNDKRTGQKEPGSNNIEFDDITDLENDLNNLVNDPINFDNFDNSSHVRFNNDSLGESTINLDTTDKTWDGYGKFNDIPIAPEVRIPSVPKMSANEILKEKVKYLRKFESLEKKGIQLTKKYDMDSNLDEMRGEYEMIMDEKSKQNSVKFQANMLMTIINGIEFLNQKFDPFDINLEGWGEQVQENITDYDEIFAALHDKWKSKANISPELQLLFQLGGSAVMVHMTNSMFKSSLPGVDDILKQNPDLMRQFQNAAVNSMNNSSPGLSNFMSGVHQNQSQRRPPSPIQTKSYQPNLREQVRPDISMARGIFADTDDGIDIRESNAGVFERSIRKEMKGPTSDMKGPGDLSEILSGLKTKKISVNETPPLPRRNTQQQQVTQTQTFREESPPTIQLTSLSTMDYDADNLNDSSRISVDDIKNIEGDFNVPKKSRRRPNSNKNVLDLNLDL